MQFIYWVRCLIGRPTTYRRPTVMPGGSYAICVSCERQTEVHDETMLQRLLGYRW